MRLHGPFAVFIKLILSTLCSRPHTGLPYTSEIYGVRSTSKALRVVRKEPLSLVVYGENLPEKNYYLTPHLRCNDIHLEGVDHVAISLTTKQAHKTGVWLTCPDGIDFSEKYDEYRLCHENVTEFNRRFLSLSRHGMTFSPYVISLCLLLLFASALCSGLNLAFMKMSINELMLLAEGGLEPHKSRAMSILWYRKQSNWLICTLAAANVVSNIQFTNLLNSLWEGLDNEMLFSYTIPTIIILLFGEILPQSLCNRNGLLIASKTRFLTMILFIICAPFAWPLSKLIDCLLGREVCEIYSVQKLNSMIKMQSQSLDQTGADICSRMVEFPAKLVKDVMTPISEAFLVNDREKLTNKFLITIVEKGFTRIPVYETKNKSRIYSVINVKDLVCNKLINQPTVAEVVQQLDPHRKLMHFVHCDMRVQQLMNEMRSGDHHICTCIDFINGKYRVVGLITFEDILEELFGDIEDDSDKAWVNRRTGVHKDQITLDWFRLSGTDPLLPITVNQHLHIIQCLATACPEVEMLGLGVHGLRYLLSAERVKRSTEGTILNTKDGTMFVIICGRITIRGGPDGIEKRLQVEMGKSAETFKPYIAGAELIANMFRDSMRHLKCLSDKHPYNVFVDHPNIQIIAESNLIYFEICNPDVQLVLQDYTEAVNKSETCRPLTSGDFDGNRSVMTAEKPQTDSSKQGIRTAERVTETEEEKTREHTLDRSVETAREKISKKALTPVDVTQRESPSLEVSSTQSDDLSSSSDSTVSLKQ